MTSVKKIIQKKGKNLFILNFVFLSLILCSLFIAMEEDRNIYDIFKGVCEVHNLQDLNHCYENNHYVRVYFDNAYSTNYGYYINNKLKAYYVDLDLEGYSLITIVKDDNAEELFQENSDIHYIEGVITDFTETQEHHGVIDTIKHDYLELFGSDWNEEQIDNFILPIQIDAYKNHKINNLCFLILLTLICGTLLRFIIKGMCMMLKPEHYKSYSKIENTDSLEQEFENQIIYQSQSICLTPNYILHFSFGKVIIKEVKSLIWAYKRVTKQYGIIVNNCYILNFKDGDHFVMNIKDEKVLEQFQTNILIGYTDENLKIYQKIVEEQKKEMR